MFNDDLMTAINMWQDKNHIELLIKVTEAEAYPEGYGDLAKETLKLAVRDYLDTYGHTEEMN